MTPIKILHISHFLTMACIHSSLCVVVLLLHFTEMDSSNAHLNGNEYYGPQNPIILGPDAVTVGVPCSYICSDNCSPPCNYKIGLDNQASEGNELAFTLQQWVTSKIVTCTATNPATGNSSTTRKTLRILEGPVDVTISGPQSVTAGETQLFLCNATCRPSCIYTWVVDGDSLSGSGDEVVIRAPPEATSETIICKATNSVSGLFVTAKRTLNITNKVRPMADHVELLSVVVFASITQTIIMMTF